MPKTKIPKKYKLTTNQQKRLDILTGWMRLQLLSFNKPQTSGSKTTDLRNDYKWFIGRVGALGGKTDKNLLDHCQLQCLIFYNQCIIALHIILELRTDQFYRAQHQFYRAFKIFIRKDRSMHQYIPTRIMWQSLAVKKHKHFTNLFHEIKDLFDEIFFPNSFKYLWDYFGQCEPDNIYYKL